MWRQKLNKMATEKLKKLVKQNMNSLSIGGVVDKSNTNKMMNMQVATFNHRYQKYVDYITPNNKNKYLGVQVE